MAFAVHNRLANLTMHHFKSNFSKFSIFPTAANAEKVFFYLIPFKLPNNLAQITITHFAKSSAQRNRGERKRKKK